MPKAVLKQKGVVLIIILGTILIVVSLAIVVLNIITSQNLLTAHQSGRIQAYYAAMAGVNYAFDKLRTGHAAGGYDIGTDCLPASPCSMLFADEDFKPSSFINPTNGITITVRQAGSAGCLSPPAPVGGGCVSVKANYTAP